MNKALPPPPPSISKSNSKHSSNKLLWSLTAAVAVISFSPNAHAETISCSSTACDPVRTVVGMPNALAPTTEGVTNNTVTLTGMPSPGHVESVIGAFNTTGATVHLKGNQINISGDTTLSGLVAGSVTNYGDASNNVINISGGTFNGDVYGGFVLREGNSSNNVINISGGTFAGKIIGGDTSNTTVPTGLNKVSGNIINISGGSFAGDIYASNANSAPDSSNNTLNISGNPTFAANVRLLGDSNSGAGAVGNTFNLHTKNINVRSIRAFSNLHFYLQSDTAANDTLLTLNGAGHHDHSNVAIGVGLEGNDSPLKKGDAVNLIKTPNGTLGTNAALENNTSGMRGISGLGGITTLYTFSLRRPDTQTLQVVVDRADLNPQVKSLSEARLAGVGFINRGVDFSTGVGLNELLKVTQVDGIRTFATISGGKSRTKTGSHIDVKGSNLVLGVGTQLPNASGALTFGAFVEGGKGSYDSYNDFTNRPDVRANGNTHYYGVGMLAKQQFNNQWFIDGGLRAGKSKLDYYSADLVDSRGNHTSFDSKSSYWGANIGVGKTIELNEKSDLIPYAKLLYMRNTGNSRKIAGSTFNFSNIESLRSHLGVRWQHKLNETSTFYADAAWEREFQGKAKGEVVGFTMPEPSLQGNTGILKVGMNFTPNEKLNINVGVQGEFGKRSGVSGSAMLKYSF